MLQVEVEKICGIWLYLSDKTIVLIQYISMFYFLSFKDEINPINA